MALRTLDENPKITDTIRIFLKTPDVNGCLSANPYKIDSIKIFYVERDFLGGNYGQYQKIQIDKDLLVKLEKARHLVCNDPSQHNILEMNRLQSEIDSQSTASLFYYKDAQLVADIGTSSEPAWLSTDIENSLVVHVDQDEEENTIFGNFYYDWTPRGHVREGDFFVCWTWTPFPAGDSLSENIQFSLMGDGKAVQTLPTHITPENKYETLLEKYLPEFYKNKIIDDDLTPLITDRLNRSVARGFTFVENYANQLIDLFDGNVVHESLLVYLSNLFNLNLKSDDPTLWRRQIKRAIPLFKKKGTLGGLEEAFSQAGMRLDKYMPLWQVVSPFTWVQSFKVVDSPTFQIDKLPISEVNEVNFGVWLRREGETEYVKIPNDTIQFTEHDCEYFITWVGDEKSADGLTLYEGDYLKIMYQYAEIPAGQQPLENYIRALTLADTRDEALQEYPPKNWNVRVIEEDDPMFDVLVSNKHPFHDHLVFGRIRTEFPYSENIYNMDTYNGSKRDSYDACFIDKGFRDPCGSCLSSKYNIDISIENLTDDRLFEVYDILQEYTPFTSVPHNINVMGEIVDYVESPVEEIDFLIKFNIMEYVLSGSANPFFHRVMEDGLTNWIVNRSDLAEQTLVDSGLFGTAHNLGVAILAPNVNFGNLGVILDNHILEVLSPSPNAGIYYLTGVDEKTGTIGSSVNEPLNDSEFTFRLSNVVFETINATITQENCLILSDSSISLNETAIKSEWDVQHTANYDGGPWKIYLIDAIETLEIQKVVGNKIYLPCNTTVGSGNNVSYMLLDDDNNEILRSTTGSLNVVPRGRVSLNDPNLLNVGAIIFHGDYMLYDGNEYLVDELRINNDLIILNYTDGTAAGVEVKFLRRLVNTESGFFQYYGLKLLTAVNHESSLGIQNGLSSPVTNPDLLLDNSNFKENYLINIDDNYYKIESIDGEDIILNGLPQDWGTIIAGGSLVEYSIYQFINNTVEAEFMVFDQLDRRGRDPVVREIQSLITDDVAISALSMPASSQGLEDMVRQEEGISLQVDYLDGTTYTEAL